MLRRSTGPAVLARRRRLDVPASARRQRILLTSPRHRVWALQRMTSAQTVATARRCALMAMTLAGVGAMALLPGWAAASSRSCGEVHWRDQGGTDSSWNIRASGTSCAQARRAAHTPYYGMAHRHFYIDGFYCSGHPAKTTGKGYDIYACRLKHARITFNFSLI
jgi:hypothetical protein